MTHSLSAWTVSVGGVAAVDLGVAVTAVAVGDFVSMVCDRIPPIFHLKTSN